MRANVITARKTKSGEQRHIQMGDTLSETLSKLPSRIGRGFVFPPNLSKPDVPYTDLNKTFRRLMSRAEIENVRFHDLRHTYASHLIMNGVDVQTVQELLGHSDIKMTMRYCHLAPDHKARAVKILDTAYQTDTSTARCQSGTNTDSAKSFSF